MNVLAGGHEITSLAENEVTVVISDAIVQIEGGFFCLAGGSATGGAEHGSFEADVLAGLGEAHFLLSWLLMLKYF